MSVRIVADSACDIRPDRDDVTIIPLTVAFGEEQYLDGVDLTHHEFYEKLIETDELPVTSQINPAAFEACFDKAALAQEDVVVITLSGKLSGTNQSAVLAAETAPCNVYVVDSENAAMGEAVLLKRACELVDAGMGAAEIADTLDREKHDIRLVALLDTLEYLKRGGRVSATAATVGNVLSIKPVIAIENGEVVVLGKARGSRKGNNLLMEQVGKTTGIDFNRPYQLAYSGLDDHLLQKYIHDSRSLWEDHVEELPVGTLGAPIGTHIGPGAIGLAFFQKPTA